MHVSSRLYRVDPAMSSQLRTVFILLLSCVSMGIFLVILMLQGYRYSNDEVGVSSLENNNNNNTRVLCLILTSTQSHDKMAAVNGTWARRCNRRLFVYGSGNDVKPADDILVVDAAESRQHLTSKMKAALIHVHKHSRDFDWILKADDDTYVIMENLKHLLSQYDPQQPGFLGCYFKQHLKLGYMSGGAGYAISAAGLRNLVERGLGRTGGCAEEQGDEDVDIGRCLHETNVSVLSSLDPQGLETFHPEPLDKHLVPPYAQWVHDYSWNKVQFGPACCSQYSITFHHVGRRDMYVYDSLIYNMAVHGESRGSRAGSGHIRAYILDTLPLALILPVAIKPFTLNRYT